MGGGIWGGCPTGGVATASIGGGTRVPGRASAYHSAHVPPIELPKSAVSASPRPSRILVTVNRGLTEALGRSLGWVAESESGAVHLPNWRAPYREGT